MSAYGYWSAYKLSENSLRLREAQEQQLIQAKKMASLNMVVASIAHEINTPIGTAITAASHADEELQKIIERLGVGEVTLDELLNPAADGKASMASVITELQRTASLVDKFKETALDQTASHIRRFELCSYINKNVLGVGLAPMIKREGLSIKLLCSESIEIDSYPGDYSQIFTNLIMNSIMHGYPSGFSEKNSGSIMIDISRYNGNKIRIHYSDDGVGMTDDTLNRVFDPFFTTKGTVMSTESLGQKGSGLGMSIVYNIVTQHLKGSIVAQSAPGQGASFIIVLPMNL